MKAYRLARRVAIFFFVLSVPLPLSAQTKQDSIQAYFEILSRIPQEKLYLHLDKPFYGAGDKIWLKGYLVDGLTHENNAKSNFVIAELVDRADSVLQRKKIRRDSLGFHNAFPLPATLPAGDYYLRAYTNWMLNWEPDFFYSRNLKIGNSIDVTIQSAVEYQQVEGNEYVAKIKFTDNMQKPFSDVKVKFRQGDKEGRVKNRGSRTTDEYGMIHVPFSLPKDNNRMDRWIEVEFDDPAYIYKRIFYLPAFSRDFDVAFFPEGGSLLAVSHQLVAFKAQGADGFSREVSGYLFNSKGDTLQTLRSEHDGMGRIFMANLLADESYSTVLTSSDGVTKRFNLPVVQPQGIALSIIPRRGEANYLIQKTEASEWSQELFLVVHIRGRLLAFHPVNKEKTYGKLRLTQMPEGIIHFMLVDGKGHPVSERLLFVRGDSHPAWQVHTDKTSYGRREKVVMQISAKGVDGRPLEGDFSVSITDGNRVPLDTLADNIVSSLLLTSDLKGYIENPGYYFHYPNQQTDRMLDLVMLTHGWRRHKIRNLLEFPSLDYSHYIEAGQIISGKVKGFFGGGVKKGNISLVAPKPGIFDTAMTSEEGKFAFDVSFKDTTSFVVQARTKKGFAGVSILMDKQVFPPAASLAPFRNAPLLAMEDYLSHTREQYYMEGGMRVYNLKEVVVKAKKRSTETRSMYVGINGYTLDSEKLEKSGATTVMDAIRHLPGITSITGDNEIFIRNGEQPALVVVDDVPYDDNSVLDSFLAPDIESLSIIRDATAGTFFGGRGSAGVIVIMLKEPGKVVSRRPSPGITTCEFLGYCDPVEFYHPAYDTPEKKENAKSDYRTTIYWNPSLKLDAEGKATIEYYMPDSTAPQNVVIEGVDKDGIVCRFVATVNKYD